jgi:hypothetical protein
VQEIVDLPFQRLGLDILHGGRGSGLGGYLQLRDDLTMGGSGLGLAIPLCVSGGGNGGCDGDG